MNKQNPFVCSKCGSSLSVCEIREGNGICEKCEIIELKKWRKREKEALKKLKGNPTYKKYILGASAHGIGCVLH